MPLAKRRQIAETWLAALSAALEKREYGTIATMMHSDGYWRDLLTFDWKFTTLHGAAEIQRWLGKVYDVSPAHNFSLEGDCALGALGEHSETLEFFFRFQTRIALGRGFARLVLDPNSPETARSYTFLTTMRELKDFSEASGRNRRRDDLGLASSEPQNWLDRKIAASRFEDRDPEVIVIGGGQSGLMLAARLGQLNVSTLVVEKTARIGDVWRDRYRSLQLHNEICMNHFAYMPFPDTWPVYIPKDKLANWLEFYAESMELNVWTSTTFLEGEYDSADRRWTVRLRLVDGRTRVMRPSYIALAVGVSGIPSMPCLEGMDEFAGSILHSSGPVDDLDVKGKSVLVVGAGTSGHDLAQDSVLSWRRRHYAAALSRNCRQPGAEFGPCI